MSKRVIYHPDPKYYDIEEKFRSKQGTRFLFIDPKIIQEGGFWV